jgi:CRISPR system Cascade subunit CasD
MPNTLFLILDGPLQSWGERSRWSVRDTAPEPTKSGVVGLLACALGLQSDEELRQLSQQVRVGVRVDRPGAMLVDYHTVTGGVLSAEGKIKKTASTGKAETVVSQRSYLCDASFLVAVQGEPGLIERLEGALHQPTWPVYLGRKSCPPSRPVYAGSGDFGDMRSALSGAGPELVRAVMECEPGNGILRRDEIASRSRRTFQPRYTLDEWLPGGVKAEVK